MIDQKKLLLIFFFSLTSSLIFGQTECKFYKSIEDYTNNKFIPGYDIVKNSLKNGDFSTENLTVKINNREIKKIKVNDYPADFFTITDEYPSRNMADTVPLISKKYFCRRYKKKSYEILAYGKFCYYLDTSYSSFPQYYSETISGPVKKFKDGILEKKLKEKGLLKSYKKDKPRREFKDNVNEYFTKEVKRTLKYVNLLNKTN